MNHGYFFLISCWILVFLIYTEWLDFLWSNSEDINRSRTKVILFFITTITLQGFTLPLSSTIHVNVGSIVLISVCWCYFFIKNQSGLRLQMLCVILFLGIFYGVAYEMMFMDPILMVASPFYMLPASMVLFVCLTTSQLYLQWMMLAGGFILGDMVHKTFMYKHVDQIFIGDSIFRDQLMMGFIMVTGVSMLFMLFKKVYFYTIRILLSLRKQEG